MQLLQESEIKKQLVVSEASTGNVINAHETDALLEKQKVLEEESKKIEEARQKRLKELELSRSKY